MATKYIADHAEMVYGRDKDGNCYLIGIHSNKDNRSWNSGNNEISVVNYYDYTFLVNLVGMAFYVIMVMMIF